MQQGGGQRAGSSTAMADMQAMYQESPKCTLPLLSEDSNGPAIWFQKLLMMMLIGVELQLSADGKVVASEL